MTTLSDKIEAILAPAINTKAPYAQEIVTALTLLIGTHPAPTSKNTTPRAELLRKRLARKLFTDAETITVESAGDKYEKASNSTSGVGLANFITSAEQEQAFNKAFAAEARAAAPYIYALEQALLDAQGGYLDRKRLDFIEAWAKQSYTGISFDKIPCVDGEPGGFRFMRRTYIGTPHKDLRAVLDAEIKRDREAVTK